MATHDVFNVPRPWSGANVFTSDRLLGQALARAQVSPAELTSLTALGALAGSERAQDDARLANAYPPVLRTHDRYGHRIDEVEFHPAWHELMSVAVSHGLQAAPWAPGSTGNAHLVRAAGFYVWGQVEQGHCCPISMSYAVLPALRHSPELAARYEGGLLARNYEFGLAEPSSKAGLLAGMAMTEKQGGSDVRANTTHAVAAGDGSYRITGHKWFCSAPMCDLFLVLAQLPEGLSCFLVPRVLPDGSRNVFALQRLKDKLGDKSNASSEVEFDDTVGWLIGEPGRGVRTILEMVTMTRLDCVIGAAGLQRAALVQAAHHVTGRAAFGHRLAEQPLMREVIADLVIEVDAATALFTRLASAVDRGENAFLRLAVAAGKFFVTKRSAAVVGEALECLGGAGYVEESPLPRYFRESPLNSIWEGSGNVMALDVLRAVRRDPESVSALRDELATTDGADPRLDAATDELATVLTGLGSDPVADARQARRLAALITQCVQASVLVRASVGTESNDLAEGFLASRLGGPLRSVFGASAALDGARSDELAARVLDEA
ncbi:acyl-CoA dehydrogenase family protein [Jatrophihabitans telluris]|uniref:Acyl-CoA dehydrogenase family protein n=1 Tax=Jatrophihabitans telluris TaxID=2038343 RepID=A0ABY4QYV8_9ACTN|nr:acyl-CoA dehydrogenase family protein [Jatrophihabitans telluris]UQX88604.1 acyl-CoA dehydrogenase family protein [Jatrophihabitans telluris]